MLEFLCIPQIVQILSAVCFLSCVSLQRAGDLAAAGMIQVEEVGVEMISGLYR
jgi:hypothetical protein